MSVVELVPTFDPETYKAPFPYMGGKSRVAAEVWARFGDVPNYVEPFFGSGAVLFKRPAEHDWAHRIETVNDTDGMVCLSPDTRLLAGDLSWVSAGEVEIGTELLAFDELNGPARCGLRAPTRYRHYCLTKVTAVSRVVKRCYRLTFDDGTCVVASEDHQWLGGSHKSGGRGWRWLTTKNMICNRAAQRSWVLKLCSVVDREETYGRNHHAVGLIAKEDLGMLEVVAIETESHTFIAEGLASHNCNFWRALQSAPEEVARYADWPVNENDLHARHVWLKGQREDLTRRLEGDPDWYDAKVAGWWVWATCLWIGTGFDADGPWVVIDGELVRMPRERGVRRQLPDLGAAGRGIHRKRPHLGDAGRGECEQWSEHLRTYMMQLAARLRRVRVCCGDWARVMGTTPTLNVGNPTGIFLDPPYSQDERYADCYSVDRPGLAEECREWCLEHGDDPRLRIALCGYAGEGHEPLEAAGWSVLAWKARGGYSNQRKTGTNDNKYRERIWFSPHCLSAEAETPHQPQLQEVVIPFDAR